MNDLHLPCRVAEGSLLCRVDSVRGLAHLLPRVAALSGESAPLDCARFRAGKLSGKIIGEISPQGAMLEFMPGPGIRDLNRFVRDLERLLPPEPRAPGRRAGRAISPP